MLRTRIRQHMRIIGVATSLVACLISHAFAQDCSLRATVEPANVEIGHTVVYVLILDCMRRPDAAPELPLVDSDWGFSDFQQAGVTNRTQIINGSVSQSVEYRYSFTVSKKGVFILPPAKVIVGGQEIKSNPVRLAVSQSVTQQLEAVPDELRGKVTSPQVPGNRRLQDALLGKLFVLAVHETTIPVSGQQFLLSYYLGIDQEGLRRTGLDVTRFRGGEVEVPDFHGFVKDEIFQVPQRLSFKEQIIGGRRYVFAPLYQVALTPSRTGKLTIEPFRLSLSFPYRGSNRGPFPPDPFDNFFDFDLVESIPITVSSIPIEIDVQPLPATNQPRDFSGAVGAFSLSAELDKHRAKANEDVIRLRVTLQGEGNAGAAAAPPFPPVDGLTLLEEPKGTSERRIEQDKLITSKTFDYLLRPTKAGEFTIPPIRLSVYNVKAGRYETLESKPLSLLVSPGSALPALVAPIAASNETTNSMQAASKGGAPTIRTDLRYIHDDPLRPHLSSPFWHRRPWVFASFGLPLLLVVASYAAGRRRERILEDVRGYRRSVARSRATAALQNAKRRADRMPQESYAAVSLALRQYFADKIGAECASALTTDEIVRLLEERGAPAEPCVQARAILEACDSVRYAPVPGNSMDVKALTDRALKLLEVVDKWL